MPRGRRRFGRVRQLPSGRWQARYHGPDGIDRAAPGTFERRADADRWLATIEDQVVHGDWFDPDASLVPLAEYGTRWIAERAGLRARTRQLYEGLFRLHIDLSSARSPCRPSPRTGCASGGPVCSTRVSASPPWPRPTGC